MRVAGLFLGFLIGVALRRTFETERYLRWVNSLPETTKERDAW